MTQWSSAGDLNRRLRIEEDKNLTLAQPITDAAGQPIADWQPVAWAWASVMPLSGREYFMAQEVMAEVTHRIRIPYQSGIKARYRAVEVGGDQTGRVFNFLSVIDLETAHRELEIMAKETES